MATIQELMPYLEQGYTAVEYMKIGPAYLRPVKQDDSLVFEFTDYAVDGSMLKQEIYSQEHVLKGWSSALRSNDWGIHLYGEVGVAENDLIDQAIADGRAHKADGF
jgi:hypothetical protein